MKYWIVLSLIDCILIQLVLDARLITCMSYHDDAVRDIVVDYVGHYHIKAVVLSKFHQHKKYFLFWVWHLLALLCTRDFTHKTLRRFSSRSHGISKPRVLGLTIFDPSGIWEVPRQECCRCIYQMSERCAHGNTQSRRFNASRNLVVRRE